MSELALTLPQIAGRRRVRTRRRHRKPLNDRRAYRLAYIAMFLILTAAAAAKASVANKPTAAICACAIYGLMAVFWIWLDRRQTRLEQQSDRPLPNIGTEWWWLFAGQAVLQAAVIITAQ